MFAKDELEVMKSNITTHTKKEAVVATDSDNNSDAETEATHNDSDASDTAWKWCDTSFDIYIIMHR